MTPEEKTAKIRHLNDQLRAGRGVGTVAFVGALAEHADEHLPAVRMVQNFTDFTSGNDPHNEHDFGSFIIGDQRFMWKIDYYDLNLEGYSPDPSNPDVTRRVLTIFYAEDY